MGRNYGIQEPAPVSQYLAARFYVEQVPSQQEKGNRRR
jgi:hypothetical protein